MENHWNLSHSTEDINSVSFWLQKYWHLNVQLVLKHVTPLLQPPSCPFFHPIEKIGCTLVYPVNFEISCFTLLLIISFQMLFHLVRIYGRFEKANVNCYIGICNCLVFLHSHILFPRQNTRPVLHVHNILDVHIILMLQILEHKRAVGPSLWVLKFSQHCSSGFCSSEVLHCEPGKLVPLILKEQRWKCQEPSSQHFSVTSQQHGPPRPVIAVTQDTLNCRWSKWLPSTMVAVNMLNKES